jgi:ATP-dependent Lon protease
VLHLSGYTETEKEAIAANYLIPSEIAEAGLGDMPPVFDQKAIRKIIQEYTREAGLRNLQRQIASVCRKIARGFLASGKAEPVVVNPDLVEEFLGPKKYHYEVAQAKDRVGVTTALAWTEAGGEIIFIESTKMRGKSNLILTGSLGDVMKESAKAALSYIRSNTELFGIATDFYNEQDIHIHVPAGAIPKDGPSAGLPIAVSLISLLTGRPCRRDVALTGELTLSGRVLPVGGIKEKVLAAHRAGVKAMVFPGKNETDLRMLPEEITRDLKIITIDELAEIIPEVLR